MKPEMSTAVMIERIREMAVSDQDGTLLNQVANRIELLLAAESSMSREMACIRHALDIPPDQSVQSGVVNAFVRLNGEILELRNQLAAELADKCRMDWLISHYVEVRTPLVYGSHALFVAQTVSEDWAEIHATSLREQIDAAMIAAAPQLERKDGDA
ncbi:hypothetical protein [Pectobacterium zantedeschiae]|uniref:Uncharacterized protein n=1 Tax=Pectobacterium zantedeschiae TaxID=2034769 RepID=A0A9X8JJK0_9GAMM|nr:hypothetical protein [Pectobacterium zantedeschiae]RYC44632.1 hypothetical protein CLR69_06340 [Pectobacterium zantedeschiae]RYC49789.1 hypothetical protein CTN06_02145 [Pectobacterium zantedeschiae]